MKLDAGNAVVTKLTCRFLSFVSAVFMIMAGFLIPAVQAGAPYGDPNQPYDKLPGILESYHVNWATPLPGGKLKVLFFIPYFNSREVVELRQRLDLDYTVIMTGGKSAWAQGYVEGGSASPIENAENLVDRIARERLDLQKTYDAIIIGKVSWEVIPKEFRDLIMRHVQRGTALVYVSANRSGAGWNADNPEATTADPQYASMFGRNLMPEEGKAIFATLPFDLIPLKTVADAAEFAKLSPPPQAAPNVPAQQAVSIRVSEEGKGRIVVLDYHDKGGKWQSFNSLTPSVDYDQVMYDYVYALLAKCVLYGVSGEPKVKAAVTFASPVVPPAVVPTNLWDKKKPTVVLDRDGLATAKLQLTVAAASDVTAKLTLDLSIRDSRGATMKNEQSSLGVIAGKTESRTLPLPTLPRGDYTIDLRVLNEKGAVFDFASTSFRVDSPFQVAKIETDKALYEKGEKIQGKVFFAQALAGNQTAGVTAIDTWDRIVNRAAVMLSADRLSGVFSIPVDLPLSRLWDIRVAIRDAQGEVDVHTMWVGLPNWNFDEYFVPLIFSTSPDHDWKGYMYTEQARKYGINGANVYLIYGFTYLYEKYERAHLQSISYAEHLGEIGLGSGNQFMFQGKFDKEYTGPGLAELGQMVRSYADSGQPIDTKKYPEALDFGNYKIDGAWINGRMKDYQESMKFGSPYYFLTGENYLLGEGRNEENSGFSPYCTKLFQDWCREQYKGDLSALNAEWGSSFKSWEDVRGILMKDAATNNQLPRWVAFRYFMRSRVFCQFFINWTDMMRKVLGRDVLTGTNGHEHHDHSRYRKQMTSGKLYTGQEMNSEYRGCVGEELRESFSGDRSFLINSQSQMMFNFDFQTPLNNHRLPWKTLFAGYRGFDWEQGLSTPAVGGMSCFTPDYSEPLPFFKNISDEVLYLQSGIGKLCITAKPQRAPVAILWSPINHYISRLLPMQDQSFTGTVLYNASVDGGAIGDALVLMKSLRLRPTFIAPEDLAAGDFSKRGFKALILPYNKGMSAAEAAAIRDFVKAGGLVIADNEPGSFSRFGKKLDKGLLADLFPVTDKENIVKVGKGTAAYLPNTINGYLGRFEKCDYAGSDSVALLLRKYAGIETPVELTDSKGKPRRDTLMPIFLQGSAKFVGLLRADSSAGKEPEETVVKFDRPYNVWEVRSSKYYGLVDTITIKLDMYPQLLALLPANPKALKLTVKKSTVKQGETLAVTGEIVFDGGREADIAACGQVVHVEVLGPDGKELEFYRDNVLFAGRSFSTVLPISYSEKAGAYKVVVKNPVTGMQAEAVFTVVSSGEAR